jgi:hypothetical protein
MSLEQQIETLNGNFATLIALLSSGEVPKPVGKRKAVVIEQPQQADTPPADKPSPPAATSTAAQQPAASSAPAITADHITKAIVALVAKDKPAALAVLAELGVKKGGELTEAQRPEAFTKLSKALEAHPEAHAKLLEQTKAA